MFRSEMQIISAGLDGLMFNSASGAIPLMAPRVRGLKIGSHGISRIRQVRRRQEFVHASNDSCIVARQLLGMKG